MKRQAVVAVLGSAAVVAVAAPFVAQKHILSPSESGLRAAGTHLVIYTGDFGMVQQPTPVEVRNGINRVTITDVSRQIDPNSVIFTPPQGLEVVGTTFNMGASAQGSMIRRLSGRTVELILPSNDGKLGDRLTGKLEVLDDGSYILRTADRVYVNPPGTLSAKDDGGAPTEAGLSLQIQSRLEGKQMLDMAYLTRGLSWQTDYVGTLDEASSQLTLESYATVTNQTGYNFPLANITFVSGHPNEAVRPREKLADMSGFRAEAKAVASDAPMMAPQAMGEGYRYEAPFPAEIGMDQMNRIPFLTKRAIPVRLDYSVRLPSLSPWGSPQSRVNATLGLSFPNQKEIGLGLPLPGGAVRMYAGSTKGAYVGAATLPDLPVGDTARLTMSESFDIYAQPSVVATKRINKRTVEKQVRVVVRNAKDNPVRVRLVQPFDYGRWQFTASSAPREALNARTVQWTVMVPAKGETVVTGTVRVDE